MAGLVTLGLVMGDKSDPDIAVYSSLGAGLGALIALNLYELAQACHRFMKRR